MQEMYAEDAVLDVSAVFTDVGPIRGHDSMLGYWLELRDTWAGLRLDPIEVLDVGDGRYVVDLRLSGKGRSSGADSISGSLFSTRCAGTRFPMPSCFPT